MDKPEAKVIAVRPGSATVSVDRALACRRCAAGRGCGAGIFSAATQPALIDVNVPHGIVLEVGDRVALALLPARILQAAWLVYGLPLVAMVVAVLIASRFVHPGSDLAAVSCALLGLSAGAWLGHRKMNTDGCLRQFVPTICERAVRRSAGAESHATGRP